MDNYITTSINELKFEYENEVEELSKDIEFNCQIELPEINDDNDIWFDLSDLKRFSCSCHKLNLVLQKAIKSHAYLERKFDDLQKFAVECRSKAIFTESKCRPKLMVQTRWFTQIHTLIWAKKCYGKNLFDNCPFTISEIDLYLQILLPAYNINLIFQKTNSCIGDVLPFVVKLKTLWSRLDINIYQREFCYFLVSFLQKKFDTELKSDIYRVS